MSEYQTQIDHNPNCDAFQIPKEFSNLPPDALDKMADYYERLSKMCRRKAEKLHSFERIQARANERFNDLSQTPKLVLKFLAEGVVNTETAIKKTAEHAGVSYMCVKTWYDKYLISKNADFKKHRDQAIVQMIGLGLPYQTIAARIGVHHNTITRAVKRELGVVLTAKDKQRIKARLLARAQCQGE